MKKLIAILMLILATTATTHAQIVSGTVVDENSQPMEFVNVVLANSSDSTFVAGTVTKEDGSFAIETTSSRRMFIRVSSVGYSSVIADVTPTGQMGTIAMQPSSVMLGEVTVSADLPVTAIKGDAMVTGVENTVLAHAGTANDVLTQVPMVLGRDGNFEVFGKGSPLIYINGRKVEDNTELSQLNSADIKTVEVVTNPGARYDASVRAVIRIRTKRPQGDGWSGTLRSQNGFRPCFVTMDQANLKYRTGGLELFGNFGYMGGTFRDTKFNGMSTRATTSWQQDILTTGESQLHDLYGKLGFSYLLNDRHSFGAWYSNGLSDSDEDINFASSIMADNEAYDAINTAGRDKEKTWPKHHVNAYYNGMVGNLGIDFNLDYLWKKSLTNMHNDEVSENFDNSVVVSHSDSRSRMIAEKLVISYPLWNGGIEVGEEFSSSRFSNVYSTDAAGVSDASTLVEEKNTAGFIQIMQGFGRFNIAAGVRYEHVTFDYFDNGQTRPDQSKRYDNFFPSLSMSAMVGKTQLSLSYSNKTRRPSYADLDGTVDYINRITLESGNPYLVPERIHSVELTGAWRQFFGQVSYSQRNNPVLFTTNPYGDNGEIKLITKENFPKIQQLQAFVGGQFQFGVWYPKVNVGIIKQWLSIDYGNSRKALDNPMALVQFQNAIHLPGDIWLNIDLQWMSAGDSDNTHVKATSYLNAKLYKSFCDNRFSITAEANDIFNKSNRELTLYSKDVTINQINMNNNRSFLLTLQYNFNVTRDRYRGSGAGNEEQSRL